MNAVEHNVINLLKYEKSKVFDSDHVATPKWVVEDIYKLIGIESFSNIWFPFDHYDSEFKLKADELKLQYKATHKFDDMGNDFFIAKPPKDCEIMISNPPFSIQNQIIERSFELVDSGRIKSFCLLLPLSTLETEFRSNMYQTHSDKLSIIIFKKRIIFQGCSKPFNKACCWVCYNINNLQNKILWI